MAFTISYGDAKRSGRDRFNRMPLMWGFVMALSSFVVVCGCERAGGEKEVRISDGEAGVALADVSCPGRSGGLSLQDLERTFCEIGTNGVPLGGGFLMSHVVCDRRMYYVVSADHVFRGACHRTGTFWLAFPGTNGAQCVATNIPQAATPHWIYSLAKVGRSFDISAFDISNCAGQLAENGAAFIDFSPKEDGTVAQFCLEGVRMVQTGEFERNGVSLGTQVYALVSAIGMKPLMEDPKASVMLAIGGRVAKMPDAKMKLGQYSERYFVCDMSAMPGHSGGPVFTFSGDGTAVILGILTARMPYSGNEKLDEFVFPPGVFALPFDALETFFTEMHVAKRLGNAGNAN